MEQNITASGSQTHAQPALAPRRWQPSYSPPPYRLGDTTYVYDKLNPSNAEIRVLRLSAGSSTQIDCRLVTASLRQPGLAYIAISYCWGHPDDTTVIHLDGHIFPVTVSLWGALNALRQEFEDVTVWADAVCINQRNLDERSQQVILMAEVYREASKVAMWLGPEVNGSAKGIQLLRDLAASDGSPRQFQALLDDPDRVGHWNALVEFFGREYWQRLWILQEVVNAKAVVVLCGNERDMWSLYGKALDILGLPTSQNSMFEATVSRRDTSYEKSWARVLTEYGPHKLQRLNRDFARSRGIDLWFCLFVSGRQVCREPKDKLFGILGLLTERDRLLFQVDYKRETSDVYIDVVDFIISTTGRLDVICAAYKNTGRNSFSLPSWVPNWIQHDTWRYPITWDCKASSFAASMGEDADFSFSSKRRKLTLKAVLVSHVKVTGISISRYSHMAHAAIAFLQWQWMLQMLRLLETMEHHLTFCRTLSMGRLWEATDLKGFMQQTYRIFIAIVRPYMPSSRMTRSLERLAGTAQLGLEEAFREFQLRYAIALDGRCLFVSRSGCLGLGPYEMKPGDVVVVPLGCTTPVVLRRRMDGDFVLLGDCYIDGYMYGRAIEEWRQGRLEAADYTLV